MSQPISATAAQAVDEGMDVANELPPEAASEETLEPVGQERRRRPRLEYAFVQRVGPLIHGRRPHPRRFFQVECKDISTGGFSFYLDELPDFYEMVVALGPQGDETLIQARVAHVREIECDDGVRYLIGCRFVERKPPSVPP